MSDETRASSLDIEHPAKWSLVHQIGEQKAEIIRLRADEIEKLRAALKPFSDAADNLPDDYVDGDIWQHPVAMHITVDDLRAARAAYLGEKNE